MSDLNTTIKNAGTNTLWSMTADISQLMEIRGYKPDINDGAFLFWYQIYKELQREIDRRMLSDFMDVEG